jgi:AcrR family transcriptional regulator
MRYKPGHKENSQRRILEVASQRFRREGIASVGLAGVMADSGLTNGAFYVHFKSKEQLVQRVIVDSLERRRAEARAAAESAGLESMIRNYLSARHRDHPEDGCTTAALVGEIAHHSKPTRNAYTRKLDEYLLWLGSLIDGADTASNRGHAAALHGLLVGTLQLARAVTDRTLSDEILAGGIASALTLVRSWQQQDGTSGKVAQRAPS